MKRTHEGGGEIASSYPASKAYDAETEVILEQMRDFYSRFNPSKAGQVIIMLNVMLISATNTFTNQDWSCLTFRGRVLGLHTLLLIRSLAFCAGGPSSWRAVDEACS